MAENVVNGCGRLAQILEDLKVKGGTALGTSAEGVGQAEPERGAEVREVETIAVEGAMSFEK